MGKLYSDDMRLIRIGRGSNEVFLNEDLEVVGRSSIGPYPESSSLAEVKPQDSQSD